MSTNPDLQTKINVSLQRDEAIVILWYLSRELWNHDAVRLTASFEHSAEPHGLHALLQELSLQLIDTGNPKHSDAIAQAARSHLVGRYS
jgi:hypothetical protein